MKSLTLPNSIVARLHSKGSVEWRTRVVVNDDEHHVYDLSRAYWDCGFPTDEDGKYINRGRRATIGIERLPEEFYRNHYLHVPVTHRQDRWDKHGEDPRFRIYPDWAHGDTYRVKGQRGMKVVVKYVHCERHNRRWWWCVGMEVTTT